MGAPREWPEGLPEGLLLGTSRWSEKTWIGPFCPEGTAPADFLSHYARLIGDRKKVEKLASGALDRIVLDQRPRLERRAEVLRELAAGVPETYAFANHHDAGHGPATVRTSPP